MVTYIYTVDYTESLKFLSDNVLIRAVNIT